MSQNRLGIATFALIALIGITLWQMSSQEAEDTAPAPVAAVKVPKVDKAKVEELEISAPDKPKVRLVKQNELWRLAEPVDAAADQEAVSNALNKLAELEVSGVAASKAKNHARLEVDAAKGTHVVAKGGGKTIFDGWIGIYQSGNTMLRLEGQDAVATVRGSTRYAFAKLPREWRDRKVTDVPTESVKQITFVNKAGKLTFARNGDDWKQITGKGEKPIAPLDVSKVKGIVGTASSLNAVDFAEPGTTPEAAGLTSGAATVTLDREDDKGKSQIVYLIGAQKEQNYYLQKQGVDTIYLVSTWIGGRLTPATDTFVKKEDAPSAAPGSPVGADPHAGLGLPPGMGPGVTPGAPRVVPQIVTATGGGAKPAPAAKPAAAPAKPAAAPAKPAAAPAKPAPK